jgi:hypothetical protein
MDRYYDVYAGPVESLYERRSQLEFFHSRLFPEQLSLGELKSIIMVRMRIQEGSLKKARWPARRRPSGVWRREAL